MSPGSAAAASYRLFSFQAGAMAAVMLSWPKFPFVMAFRYQLDGHFPCTSQNPGICSNPLLWSAQGSTRYVAIRRKAIFKNKIGYKSAFQTGAFQAYTAPLNQV